LRNRYEQNRCDFLEPYEPFLDFGQSWIWDKGGGLGLVKTKDVSYDLEVTKVHEDGNNLVAKSSWSIFKGSFFFFIIGH
jgi:hypothetical protein